MGIFDSKYTHRKEFNEEDAINISDLFKDVVNEDNVHFNEFISSEYHIWMDTLSTPSAHKYTLRIKIRRSNDGALRSLLMYQEIQDPKNPNNDIWILDPIFAKGHGDLKMRAHHELNIIAFCYIYANILHDWYFQLRDKDECKKELKDIIKKFNDRKMKECIRIYDQRYIYPIYRKD